MSTAINSIFRQIKSAITSTKNNPKEAVTPADLQSIASSSGYLTPSVTSEMTAPSRGHSFVVVPGASQDSFLLTVDSLSKAKLIEYCIEQLFLAQKTTAFKHTHHVLSCGLELLSKISREWESSSLPPPATFKFMMNNVLGCSSESNQKALYHVLSTLVGYSCWLDADQHIQGFKTAPLLWALQLGPRGLARGWEEDKATIDILYRTECRYLAEDHDEAAIRDFIQAFRAWGVKMRRLVDAEEDEPRYVGR
ncbi:hypothetical protein HBH56_235200 [Parastagonospora nodorum]|uniref:Uncharacterized protein n=1 Tax=Phaeosphaeria nodorum (strain SN15 / ATCC MYA-4574 / FGSC 10173) TaxID=321614 RepID=A0A7U2I4I1_PHANO|nr:hypothetical protein HBH56_235200 [Parastagonospora nodorum]QRC99511.1 hypothetical protein JI435_144210 [Parastagonospora nodorum SN15]KAH3924415.1 hypothetical protein HBH54_193180 [Parastagonospora nodorum]KAH3959478.1 hypothetical protein HBH52_243590 [Parastagonospora nodorum]KAH4097335.1 hypothetical protein HBH46_163510 [Parastagonospora nodorum]